MFVLSTAMLLFLVATVHPCASHKVPDTVQPEAPGISHPDADIMTVVEQLQAEMMDMKARYDDMTDHYDGKIGDMKTQYDGVILEMKSHYAGVIQEMKDGHDTDITKLEERHDVDMLKMKEHYDVITNTLEKDITELKVSHNEVKISCETEISAIIQRYDDENDNIAEMKQDYNLMKTQYDALLKHHVIGVSHKGNLNQVRRDMNNEPEDQDEVNSADLGLENMYCITTKDGAQGFAAFQTYLSTPFTGPADTTIMFDDVRINIGGGYDPSTGHFTAPTAGLYVINRSHLADGSCGTAHACSELMVNGVQLSDTCSEHITNTCKTELVQLAAGDDVWLQVDGGCTNLAGSNHASFSGYLLIETL